MSPTRNTSRQAVKRAVFIGPAWLVETASAGLRPDAGPALARLQRAGYRLVLISPPVASAAAAPRAAMPASALAEALSPHGVVLDASYRCPHAGQCGCPCELPGPGLLLQAAAELALELRRSWLIGGTPEELEAGHRAGCRTVLLDRDGDMPPPRRPEHVAASLTEAVADILSTPPGARGGQAAIEEWID